MQLTFVASLITAVAGSALVSVYEASDAASASNIPLIIWHGLGDAFDSDGMKGVGDIYRQIYPGSAVYAVNLADDGDGDRRSSFFGNLNDQMESVCVHIHNTRDLRLAKAANAVGFSQGGLFMRGLVERCNQPPIRNLITFGSPHNGINTFATCKDDDWWCKTWSGTLKSNTWGGWVQTNLIPAQYFRDASDLGNYLDNSNFLADINNERKETNVSYADNIAALDRFVMIRFKDEDVVKPPVSPWFGDINVKDGQNIQLGDRALYREDWLGLRELDNSGGLIFRETEGRHMQIGDGVLENVFREYYVDEAPQAKSKPSPWDVWYQDAMPGPQVPFKTPGDDFVGYPGDEIFDSEVPLKGSCMPSREWEAEFSRLNSPWAKMRGFMRAYFDEMAGTFD